MPIPALCTSCSISDSATRPFSCASEPATVERFCASKVEKVWMMAPEAIRPTTRPTSSSTSEKPFWARDTAREITRAPS